jgi:hypothetical protein
MNTTHAAKNAAKIIGEPLETLKDQFAPIGEEARRELLGFVPNNLQSKRAQEMASGELKRARDEEKIKEMKQESDIRSNEDVNSITIAIQAIQAEYEGQTAKSEAQTQRDLKAEIAALQQEIAALSKIVGEPTNVHLESTPKKVGAIDVKRLTLIVKTWRVKAKESKDARDLVAQRQNAKPATGMLAWVSGKQMKVHEQGTMQLQG